MTPQGRGGLLKPSECRDMGEGDFVKSSLNFKLAEKLNSQFLVLYLQYMWREGVSRKVRVPSYGRWGLKLLKKAVI